MELDAIKLARLLAPAVPVVLICKRGTFLERRAEKVATGLTLCPVTFRSRVFSPALISGVRRLVCTHGIGNLVFFGASELKSLYFALRGSGVNLIVRHGTTKSRPKKDWLHRLIYRSVRRHVAISEHLARNVSEIVPLPAGVPVEVIYPSFPPVTATVKGAGERVEILHVGRLVPGKGQEEAIAACAGLAEAGIRFRLRLVGAAEDAVYAEALRSDVAACSFSDSIEFVGHVVDVDALYDSAHILLFPSHGEGFGNVLAEALMRGLVCLAFHNTALPELEDAGFYLHLLPDRNVAALGERLLAVCRDLEMELEHAAGNTEHAAVFFAQERERGQWLEILR